MEWHAIVDKHSACDLSATLKHAVARRNIERARDATNAIEVRHGGGRYEL
jgi:hypothetical protein